MKKNYKRQKPENLADGLQRRAARLVTRFKRWADGDARSWVSRGRDIYKFACRVRRAPGRKCPYKLLMEAGSPYQPSHIRNFESAYLLRAKCKRTSGAPVLSMTHFVAAIHAPLPFATKLRLLRAAEREKLSVSQLKQRIDQACCRTPPAKNDAAGTDASDDPVRVAETVKDLSAHLFRQVSRLMNLGSGADRQVKDGLHRLVHLLLVKHLVTLNALQSDLEGNHDQAA